MEGWGYRGIMGSSDGDRKERFITPLAHASLESGTEPNIPKF